MSASSPVSSAGNFYRAINRWRDRRGLRSGFGSRRLNPDCGPSKGREVVGVLVILEEELRAQDVAAFLQTVDAWPFCRPRNATMPPVPSSTK